MSLNRQIQSLRLQFAIEQRGLSSADLRDVLGSRQRVHDILQKKRKLSLEHVRALHDKLLREYQNFCV